MPDAKEIKKLSSSGEKAAKPARPQRDVMARLRAIYGNASLAGENAALAVRRMEPY